MTTKQASYGDSLVRVDLLGGFERAGAQMVVAAESTTERTRVDFAGQNMTRGEMFDVIVEHEADHHGLWSVYARLAGFATPNSWRDAWDL